MTRHSFIQMSKLSNVKGRISYITSPARQENLYATYHTAPTKFWTFLARESQQEFKRSGTEGKCIEAREFIIALPEDYTQFDSQAVLETFTDVFKERYDVECVSALHHNKSKTNYHIHLIFSERRLLPEPEEKIASRAMYYDEHGRHVRTKKEVIGNNGKLRPGCTAIKKGEVYESHLFTIKDTRFKREGFLDEVKIFYTDLINRAVDDPDHRLKVFDPNSVYLPMRKIGKHNPKAAEIEADNQSRQEWNRTADMALVTGIPEEEILKVKRTEIREKVRQSIHDSGWLPHLFRAIVDRARGYLQGLIRRRELPPKPVLVLDRSKYRSMQTLMKRLQDHAWDIKRIDEKTLPDLKQQLSEASGIFRGKERKALAERIKDTEQEIDRRRRLLSTLVQAEGYPDVQTFMAAYKLAVDEIEQYNRDLNRWEREVQRYDRPMKRAGPGSKSIRERLRAPQVETDQRQQNMRRSRDMTR